MKRRIFAVIICLVMLIVCGCQKSADVKITGKDDKVIPRLENIIELQKCLFLAKINSVSTTDAVFTKYNVDISTYTVFDVTITESFDGYTPLKDAKVYWLGTDTEFPARLSIKKNESYILDCDMWVFGDEVVYLLSPYTESYPKVDIANAVTIATSESQALNVCSLDEYRNEYKKSFDNVCARIEGFDTLDATAKRFCDIFSVMNEKNNNTAFYSDSEMGFKYKPSDEHISKTAQKTTELYEIAKNIKTKDDIAKLFK